MFCGQSQPVDVECVMFATARRALLMLLLLLRCNYAKIALELERPRSAAKQTYNHILSDDNMI